jgi:hypothetical protein
MACHEKSVDCELGRPVDQQVAAICDSVLHSAQVCMAPRF